MPEKSSKKSDGIIEKALKYVYDSVANSGAGQTIQRRKPDMDAAIEEMSTGRKRDNQSTDSNN